MNFPAQILFLLAFFVISSSAMAADESSDKGRLDDGRAYRVDKDGFQIIDQVAELEVASDDLRRQVVALEDELKEKNKLIERLGGAKYLEQDRVNESDLLSGSKSKLPRAKTIADLKKKSKDCGEHTVKLQQELEELEKESLAQIESLKKAQQLSQDKQRELEQQIAQLQQQVSGDAEKTSANQALEKQANALKETNAKLEAEVEKLQARVLAANQQLEKFGGAQKITSASSSRRQSRAMLAPKVIEPVSMAYRSPENKRKFFGSLKKIQSKIMKRKQLIDGLKKSKKGVLISASPLRTAGGISLDRIRREVRYGGILSDYQLREAILEIHRILNRDIKTAQRLTK
jgi:DNA repair exonuclease SbcCD ATPase subunit